MSQFSSRTLDQEPDTIAIVPEHPGFMVIGTYSLTPASPSNSVSSSTGSLQLLPASFAPAVLSTLPNTSLSSRTSNSGIYDIKFHPNHPYLLGVATSNAEIQFYEVDTLPPMSDIFSNMRLNPVGRIRVEEPHPDDGRRAIITRFQFLSIPKQCFARPDSGKWTVYLVATTQFGNTKLVKVWMPQGGQSRRFPDILNNMESQIVDIHKQAFDLEAWTTVPIMTGPSTIHFLSGGDDSQLLISSIEMPTDEAALDFDLITPTKQLTDKRTHEAGVVSICNLGLHPPQEPVNSALPYQTTDEISRYLILTGSYDEKMRLFLFNPASPSQPITKLTLLTELNLGGGVWQIIKFDTYETSAGKGRDYLLAIAAHTAGACIVRLSLESTDTSDWTYELKVEKWFTEGHESIVYAVAVKQAIINFHQDWEQKTWNIVSASFYDKKVCDWAWVDEDRVNRVMPVSL